MNESDRPSALPRAKAARLVSVTVGDWPPLGSTVELAIAPRRTVLVDKGSSMGSILVRGIAEGARMAVHALSDPDKPRHFRCELVADRGERLVYAYDRRFQDLDDEDDPFPPSMRWEERAATRTEEANVDLWTVRDRRVVFGDGTRASLPSGVGALALAGDTADRVPEDARRIRSFLEGIRWLGASLPRPVVHERCDVTLTGRSGVLWTSRGLDPRLLSLASTLVLWFEQDRERFGMVAELGHRIGAPGELRVSITLDSKPRAEIGPQDRASITFEGIDFGRLPDTVLRRLELLVALVDPNATALLVEEPESAAVPGMIGKLLDVIEASLDDRQIILSTKTPHVIDWARPEELRLVENVRGRGSSVRCLDNAELTAARAHLGAGGKLSTFSMS